MPQISGECTVIMWRMSRDKRYLGPCLPAATGKCSA